MILLHMRALSIIGCQHGINPNCVRLIPTGVNPSYWLCQRRIICNCWIEFLLMVDTPFVDLSVSIPAGPTTVNKTLKKSHK